MSEDWSKNIVLEGDNVQVSFPGENGKSFVAIESLSFAVRRGEKFMLLGPSGCGKTTLLKAIAGFQPLTSGELLCEGKPITRPGPDRAVVFQEFDQLFAWQTVMGNIKYALKVVKGLTGKAAEARSHELLKLVGIDGAADKYPHTLSGGMKMRVAIARALALEPEILLLDEPFAALDAITRAQLQLELNRIWQKTGITIVMVTHSIEEAIFLGDRVMVMTAAPAQIKKIISTTAVDSFESKDFAYYTNSLRHLLIPDEQVA